MSDENSNETSGRQPERARGQRAREALRFNSEVTDRKIEKATAPLIERIDELERRVRELERGTEKTDQGG